MMAAFGRLRLLWLGAALLAIAAGHTGSASGAENSLRRFGAHVEIDDENLQGVIAGGADVRVKGRSSGRIVLLGASVQLDADVADSAYIAAGSSRAGGKIQGDLSIYGGQVQVSSAVQGNLSAVGAKVSVTSDSKVGGEGSLTGHEVVFAGEIDGPLDLDATTVELSGEVKGPLRIEATRLHIAEGARIEGDADLYTTSEPVIDNGAKITGHVTRHSLTEANALRALAASGPLARILPGLFLLGSALMAGLLFLWLGRGGAEGTIDELIDSPAASGGWGLAALVLLPVAVVVLTLTIIGAPVGVLALLALPLMLLLGYACAGLGLGEWFFNRLGEPRSAGLRALHLLAGLLLLGLIGLIPWIGSVVIVVATVCGLGAILRTLHDRLRGRATV